MKILAVDTATRSCSAAVIDGEALLAETTNTSNQTHSRHLLDTIDAVIEQAGLEITELDGFAVSNGPGSFTGLRIGIASIKGLAFSLGKPVVGVSSLDALAWQCAQSAYLICPLLDARKKEVYACRYRYKNNELKKEYSFSSNKKLPTKYTKLSINTEILQLLRRQLLPAPGLL